MFLGLIILGARRNGRSRAERPEPQGTANDDHVQTIVVERADVIPSWMSGRRCRPATSDIHESLTKPTGAGGIQPRHLRCDHGREKRPTSASVG
jgi:hypothetical protein